MNLIFDIETNGLYDDVTCIHCIGVYDLDTKQTLVYNDEGSAEPITKGVQLLEDASGLVGHNIIGYDIPVIRKLFPWFTPTGVVMDTLVLSRIYHADILKVDQTRKWNHMPLQLYGRHSLESYGYRLGEYKGSFGKTADWKEWSEDMQEYMLQDVKVTTKLWNHFRQKFLTS
jgi:RNase_H superfamily